MPKIPTHGKWVTNKDPDRGKVRTIRRLVSYSKEEYALLQRAAEIDDIDEARIARAGAMAEVVRRLKRAGVETDQTS